jgi:ribosomal protein L7/L12
MTEDEKLAQQHLIYTLQTLTLAGVKILSVDFQTHEIKVSATAESSEKGRTANLPSASLSLSQTNKGIILEEYDRLAIYLIARQDGKIAAIKHLRNLSNLSLYEAKVLTEDIVASYTKKANGI